MSGMFGSHMRGTPCVKVFQGKNPLERKITNIHNNTGLYWEELVEMFHENTDSHSESSDLLQGLLATLSPYYHVHVFKQDIWIIIWIDTKLNLFIDVHMPAFLYLCIFTAKEDMLRKLVCRHIPKTQVWRFPQNLTPLASLWCQSSNVKLSSPICHNQKIS